MYAAAIFISNVNNCFRKYKVSYFCYTYDTIKQCKLNTVAYVTEWRREMLKRGNRAIFLLVLIIYVFTVFGTASVSAYDGKTEISECGITYKSRILELLFGTDNKQNEGKTHDTKETKVYVGGDVFGAKVMQRYVSVVEADSPCGISAGDKIIAINGIRISDTDSLKRLVKTNGRNPLSVVIRRGSTEHTVSIMPKVKNGEFTLGISLRDEAAGIGTVTFVGKNGEFFGGLGHGICDSDTGEVIEISGGDVTGVILGGVEKGAQGKPGELCGILTPSVKGAIVSNTECGVFGNLSDFSGEGRELMEVGCRNEVHRGEAKIISTVKNGKKSEYSVEIFEVDRDSTGTKSFKIRVTDPTLIALTGGIVRGMSGSPIIQDGKLVGAVTHVLVANPTEGYGIFIENMLNAAQSQVQPKAA